LVHGLSWPQDCGEVALASRARLAVATKSELLQVRLTGGEKERLERMAHERGVSVSVLVRGRLFGGEPVFLPVHSGSHWPPEGKSFRPDSK